MFCFEVIQMPMNNDATAITLDDDSNGQEKSHYNIVVAFNAKIRAQRSANEQLIVQMVKILSFWKRAVFDRKKREKKTVTNTGSSGRREHYWNSSFIVI